LPSGPSADRNGSNVERRLVGLFVLCALAPLILAGVFLYREFDQTLQRTEQVDLDRDVRVYGMTLMGRLADADDALNAIIQSGVLDDSELAASVAQLPWAGPTRIVAREARTAWASNLPALTSAQRLDLQRDRAALAWQRRGSDAVILYLVRALRSGNTLWVEISQPWLWADVDGYFADTALGVEAGTIGRVYSGADTAREGPPLRSQWELFLPSHFAAVPWRVTATRPAMSTLQLLQGAKVVFPAIVALTILVVSLLAISLIRRQLRPLQELVAGTRRIARRNFSTPIRIEGTDEFQRLAQSFNDMTDDLRQQFAALETLSEVDRLLLQSPAIEDVLDALLPKISAILGCRAVSVLLTDEDSRDHVRSYDYCHGGPTLRPVRRVAAEVALLEAACAHNGKPANLLLQPHIGTLLEPMLQAGAHSFALHALKTSSDLSGILLIGLDNAAGARNERAVRPEEFAARLSVALDKIEQTTRLHRQAHYDALTGLANRRLFLERLSSELASDGATGPQGAVFYVDLDQFKRVNDTEGHGAGDQLLCAVADRLKHSVGRAGIAARLGGDEFAILLPGLGDVDAVRQLAQQLLKDLAAPIAFGTRQRNVGASIGIALYPLDASDVEGLMKASDVAMYRAKDLGRGQAVFFKAEMQQRLEAVAAMETGLHRALREQQLSVVYQPIYASHDGRMRGAEALVRWPTIPGEAARSPSQFIPVAEESGLIVELGAWVLRTSCRQYMLWHRQGLSLEYITVNVSARQLVDAQFVDTVERCLEQCSMAPAQLQIEITESVLAETGASTDAIHALAAMGVRLALDDFGTGFSSLSYLRSFPINTIKIDQSFVRALPSDPTACQLVEAMLAMARAVGHDVVAEGVETVEQREFLTAAGCGSLQGYLLGRPMEADDLGAMALLNTKSAVPAAAVSRAAG
jgi:diguanylate cyclase